MDYNDYTQSLQELYSGNIAEQIQFVNGVLEEIDNWEISAKVKELTETYERMLAFTMRGYTDPRREEIIENVRQGLIGCVCKMMQFHRVKSKTVGLYSIAYKHAKNMDSLESAISELERKCVEINEVKHNSMIDEAQRNKQLDDLYQKKDSVILSIFNYEWTNVKWDNVDIEQANRFLFSEALTVNEKCVFISAITLSLMFVPDKAKLLLLLDCYLMGDVHISQRALVGFVIAYDMHDESIGMMPEVEERLIIYQDDPEFLHDVYSTMMQLQITAKTEMAGQKLEDTLKNVMSGFNAKDVKDFGNKSFDDVEALIKKGGNPEWMDEKMDKTMKELRGLSRDYADTQFSLYKGYKNGSFFGRLPHWFYLFSFDELIHTSADFKSINKDNLPVIEGFLRISQSCDSDKYSTCYMLNQLLQMNGSLFSRAKDQMNELKEHIDELAPDAVEEDKNVVRSNYIRDLYRFYMCNTYASEFHTPGKKNEFISPFSQDKLYDISPLRFSWTKEALFNDPKMMARYADFLMRNGFYSDAIELYDALLEDAPDEKQVSLRQKIGFCYQKSNNMQAAVEAYTIADQLKPHSKWTLTHLATLSVTIGAFDNAITYYKQLCSMEEDDIQHLSDLLDVCYRMRRYDEALPVAYKLSYLQEDSWTLEIIGLLLRLGKLDQAEEVCDKAKPVEHDRDIELCKVALMAAKGEYVEALNMYNQLMSKEDVNEVETLTSFIIRKLNSIPAQFLADENMIAAFKEAIILQISLNMN